MTAKYLTPSACHLLKMYLYSFHTVEFTNEYRISGFANKNIN